MSIKIYFNYLKYLIKHKYYVAIECFKMGLYIHAFTHDLSKFKPKEFIIYAKTYFGPKDENIKEKTDIKSLEFKYAWLNHQRRNKHHWNFWICVTDGVVEPLPMPPKYIRQMVADWEAVGKVLGRPARAYYEEYKDKILIHEETEKELLKILGGKDG